MTEDQVDALIYSALSTESGRAFHQWLINNYLMTPSTTAEPNQALVLNAQACFVAGLNTRYARYMEKDNAASRETKPGRKPRARKPGASRTT